ncbi:Uncharacterized protein TCM_027005 [Theobroma cacao]|uniref:Alpha N-terminal protein methyltransferase 1 n=1 Tax=Theobroma cacao TaxID=3641 RepID=A0A061G893_THECC|nr:Uncharacterized protein TCM_027005 [Theobroma cacao]
MGTHLCFLTPLPFTILQVDLLEPVSHFLDAARESLSQEYFVASDAHKASNFYCVPLQSSTLILTPPPFKSRHVTISLPIYHKQHYLLVEHYERGFHPLHIQFHPQDHLPVNRKGLYCLVDSPYRLPLVPVTLNLAQPATNLQSYPSTQPVLFAGLDFFSTSANKSSTTISHGFVLDKEDRSITRSDLYFKDLFRRCGLHLYKIKVMADQKGLPEELFAVKMYALTTEGPKKVLKTRSKAQANRPGIIK